jgi:maltose O-acetyltransferase
MACAAHDGDGESEMTTAIETTAQLEQPQARTINGKRILKALRSPKLILWSLNARRHLFHCNRLPLTVRLRGRARVENAGRIEIGDRVLIDGRTVLVELVAHEGGVLAIGPSTYINYGVSISAHDRVSIGRDCQIGNYTLIMDNDYHDMNDHLQLGESRPIVIEDGVWLGARVTVLKGVRIGAGSVVGAGAVVTKDIPPRSFAAGVPAKVVRAL